MNLNSVTEDFSFLDKINKYRLTRNGGYVKRCHTVPHTFGEYTNGFHSYNCLNILLVFHPNPSIDLIKAVQWHDVCEFLIGDLPGHVGLRHPKLREEYKIAEQQEQDLFSSCFSNLSEEDNNWLWYVDILELANWSREQWNMGNRYVGEILTNISKIIDEREQKIPEELIEFQKRILMQ